MGGFVVFGASSETHTKVPLLFTVYLMVTVGRFRLLEAEENACEQSFYEVRNTAKGRQCTMGEN